MASLYKPLVFFHRTADGRRCPSNTPGARLHCAYTRLWYGEYQDGAGAWHRVPLDVDEDAARRRLEELVRRDQAQESAAPDPAPTPQP